MLTTMLFLEQVVCSLLWMLQIQARTLVPLMGILHERTSGRYITYLRWSMTTDIMNVAHSRLGSLLGGLINGIAILNPNLRTNRIMLIESPFTDATKENVELQKIVNFTFNYLQGLSQPH